MEELEKQILEKTEENKIKLEQIYHSVERTRKYFLYTLIITLALIILPLIGLLFVLPQFWSLIGTAYRF